MKLLTVAPLVFALGCASTMPEEAQDTREIDYDCVSVEARMLRKPWIERHGKRLMMLLRVEEKTRLVRAVAQNQENDRVLSWAKSYLDRSYDRAIELSETDNEGEADPYYIVGMCGDWIEGEWEEFAPGVIDFEIILLAVYDTWSGRYLTVRTNYGDRWSDAVKGIKWKSLVIELGKKGAKAVTP